MPVQLNKGSRVSLEKADGTTLSKVCVGVNWGAIEKKGFFGGVKKESVDLDASIGTFDRAGNLLETIYFGNLSNSNRSIRHSGDDRTGDLDGDDGLDNEVITIDLNNLPAQTESVAVVLNSFSSHDFKDIPFASVRLYEGTPTNVKEVLATYDIANDTSFAGSVSMILGRLYKHNGDFKFEAIGESTQDRRLNETLNTFKKQYI